MPNKFRVTIECVNEEDYMQIRQGINALFPQLASFKKDSVKVIFGSETYEDEEVVPTLTLEELLVRWELTKDI